MRGAIKILIMFSLFLLMFSCTTTKYIVEEVPIETIRDNYIVEKQLDSIYIHDSIDRYRSGDTLYVYKYRVEYRYLEKRDTILQNDTISIPVKITQETIKEVHSLYWWQKVLMYLGLITIVGLGIYLYKRFKK